MRRLSGWRWQWIIDVGNMAVEETAKLVEEWHVRSG
jgi:hypothetical protein